MADPHCLSCSLDWFCAVFAFWPTLTAHPAVDISCIYGPPCSRYLSCIYGPPSWYTCTQILNAQWLSWPHIVKYSCCRMPWTNQWKPLTC